MSTRSPVIEERHEAHGLDHPAGSTRKLVRVPLATLLGVVVIYGVTLALLPADGFWINDNGSKFILLDSIIRSDYRDFSIDWPGAVLDPHFDYNPLPVPFGRVVGDRLFSSFSPFFPLVASFPYRAIGSTGLYVLPLLGGLLTLPAVWLLAGMLLPEGRSRRIAQPLAVGISALGTPMWFYSVTFWEHTPAVCLTTWSVLFGARYVVSGVRREIAIAGALCGAAIFFRDELYLFAAVLAGVSIFARRSPADGASFALGFLPIAALLWWFQSATLGSAIGHHLTSLAPFEGGLRDVLAGRWIAARNLLLASHRDLAVSLAITLPFLALWIACPRVSRRTFLWLVPAAAGVAVACGLVVIEGHASAPSPLRWLLASGGLFATTPALILAFVRFRGEPSSSGESSEDSSRVETALWGVTLFYPLLYVCISPDFHSIGIHWGCRYLLSVFPVLAVLAASAIARWWVIAVGHPVFRSVILLALAVTVATQIYGLQLLYQKKQHSVGLQQIVADRPEEVIVAQGWYVPQELARVFFDKPIFSVTGAADRSRLLPRLRAAGYDDVLLVSVPPAREEGHADRQILSDGALRFMTVELRNIPLRQDRTP
ncbi:MAG: hypothetical protein AAEJ52_10855 [Myxococcota bacterium]